MRKTIKIGIVSYVVSLVHSVIWLSMIALILWHIDATTFMWCVFWILAPMRILVEMISKKLIKAFNEDRECRAVCDSPGR